MIKAVIFDLDNTLVDFWAFKTKSVDSAIKAMIKAGLKKQGKSGKLTNLYTGLQEFYQ